ncbi:MAG TPA: ABC transporter permease [Chryseolinea sp.]
MIQNYFKTAIRGILREKYYALIKIFGLALGLGTTMVIFLYVAHELSYDNFHPDIDRMFCITQTNIWDPKGGVFNSTGPAVAAAIAGEIPEIDAVLRVNTPGGQLVRYTKPGGDVVAINEEKVLAADSNFFSFFGFKLKEGDQATALNGVGRVVLSDEAAQRLFGDLPALGKIIQIGDERITVEVTGVTRKQPTNAHFHFDYLISMHTNPMMKEFEWSWIFTQVVTYVKVKPNADLANLRDKLKNIPDRHALATFQKLEMDYDAFKKERGGWNLFLHPVKDIHLHSSIIGNRLGSKGDVMYVYVFSAVGFFILVIAIINFINLSTARAAKRSKEVGVKKALGVLRKSLIVQFQIEHIMMAFAATLLGLGIMEILRLIIQPIIGVQFSFSTLDRVKILGLLVLTPIVVGFLAGLYPAFYLTSFRPSEVLKGKLLSGFKRSKARNSLVIFQFTISIVLMVITLVVFQQLKFFQSKNVGFDAENLLVINHSEKLGNQIESFREEVSRLPGVMNASLSMNIRGRLEDIYTAEGSDRKLSISHYKIDEHFFETTKISLVAGRTFDKNRPSDMNSIIITETTCNLIGWTPNEALGKRIRYLGDDVGAQEIIGVAKDFHLHSLRENIFPFMFYNIHSNMFGQDRITLVRYKTEDFSGLIRQIEGKWNQLAEAVPFSYSFYDEDVESQYKQEQRLAALFLIFTGLSIVIAIMGLVGLVSYSAEQRKKEIGVRKVFGASLSGIYIMINKDYIRLMLMALLIATPTSWLIMQEWLNTIPIDNRVTIHPVVYIVAFGVELILALICVGYLALRAASLNPSAVLKEE